jgi:hypothetical protein
VTWCAAWAAQIDAASRYSSLKVLAAQVIPAQVATDLIATEFTSSEL